MSGSPTAQAIANGDKPPRSLAKESTASDGCVEANRRSLSWNDEEKTYLCRGDASDEEIGWMNLKAGGYMNALRMEDGRMDLTTFSVLRSRFMTMR